MEQSPSCEGKNW